MQELQIGGTSLAETALLLSARGRGCLGGCATTAPAKSDNLIPGHAADQRRMAFHRIGIAQEKALDLIARLAAQESELLFGFDTFGQNRQPEAVPKRDDGARD